MSNPLPQPDDPWATVPPTECNPVDPDSIISNQLPDAMQRVLGNYELICELGRGGTGSAATKGFFP
jgi:hypothetical protein